jgi:hypothetical protein
MASILPFALAAGAPLITSLLTPRPEVPQFQGPDVSFLKDEAQQLLQQAAQPNIGQFQRISDLAADQINRQLGRRNLLDSSAGLQTQALTQADLANKFLENELQRRMGALGAAGNVFGLESGQQQQQFQSAQQAFQDELSQRNQLISGVGGLAGGIAGAVERGRQREREDLERQRQQELFERIFFGVPGSPTTSTAGGPAQSSLEALIARTS